jgi:magnesium transporter
MIKIYQKTIKDRDFRELNDFGVGSWVLVENPTDEEFKKITEELGLEESLLRDAVDPSEVPRLEVEENGDVYFFSQIPYGEGNEISTAPVLMVIADTCLVTVSQRELPFKVADISKKFDLATTQKAKLFLQLLTEINSIYSRAINGINREVRSRGIYLGKVTNKDVAQFVYFETILNDFLSNLVPMNQALGNLLSGRAMRLYDEDKDLIEDLVLASGQQMESARANLKTIVNIRQAYMTIATNDLNRVIRLLTALTVVLTIPMIVTSFYGMNVMLPGASSPEVALWIAGGTGLVMIVLLAIFIKNRWL